MHVLSVLIIGTGLTISACQSETKSHSQAQARKVENAAHQSTPMRPSSTASVTFQAALSQVLEKYIQMQRALSEDELGKGKEAFSGLHAIMHMMPVQELDSATLSHWHSHEVRIMAVLHDMASSETMEEFRLQFAVFTPVLSEAIETFGIQGNIPYLFHCPMANANKGAYWIQTDRQPANPYMGKAMPECGQLVGSDS